MVVVKHKATANNGGDWANALLINVRTFYFLDNISSISLRTKRKSYNDTGNYNLRGQKRRQQISNGQ